MRIICAGPVETADPLIARCRWMQWQGHLYQAIVVVPRSRADSPDIAKFLGSLVAIPLEEDNRGLTRAWQPIRSREEGFTVLWAEVFRELDGTIHVVEARPWSVAGRTFFTFQRSMGFAVAVDHYYPPRILNGWGLPCRCGRGPEGQPLPVPLHPLCAELLAERPIDRGLAGRELEAKLPDSPKQTPDGQILARPRYQSRQGTALLQAHAPAPGSIWST